MKFNSRRVAIRAALVLARNVRAKIDPGAPFAFLTDRSTVSRTAILIFANFAGTIAADRTNRAAVLRTIVLVFARFAFAVAANISTAVGRTIVLVFAGFALAVAADRTRSTISRTSYWVFTLIDITDSVAAIRLAAGARIIHETMRYQITGAIRIRTLTNWWWVTLRRVIAVNADIPAVPGCRSFKRFSAHYRATVGRAALGIFRVFAFAVAADRNGVTIHGAIILIFT